jgi:hypothetical protein
VTPDRGGRDAEIEAKVLVLLAVVVAFALLALRGWVAW